MSFFKTMGHLLISIKLAVLAVVFVSFVYQNTIHFSNGVSDMGAQFGQEKRIQDYHDENKNVYMYIQG